MGRAAHQLSSQATLGENFCESWTYSACLNIVDECQRANERKAPDRDTSAQFTAAKAELLELARKQVRSAAVLV